MIARLFDVPVSYRTARCLPSGEIDIFENLASLKNASMGILAGSVVAVCACTLPIDNIKTTMIDQIRISNPFFWFILCPKMHTQLGGRYTLKAQVSVRLQIVLCDY